MQYSPLYQLGKRLWSAIRFRAQACSCNRALYYEYLWQWHRVGPVQTARPVKADITAHTLSWINNRHVNLTMLDAAMVKLINYSNSFALTQALGDVKRCGADGTLCNIYEDNLIAETHYRYKNKDGIAYHHIADNYIALPENGIWVPRQFGVGNTK